MSKKNKPAVKRIGILTSGGDCPGLNAAIRGVAKTVMQQKVEVLGILDGFKGLIEKRTRKLEDIDVAGILTLGGTILGTSRNKPHRYMGDDGVIRDMTEKAVKNYHELGLDALVCLGGGGTQKNAYRLMDKGGINVVTLPKTIDNDVFGTDVTFGYDTGVSIATEAIDRLHTTASSHHRCMLVDIMGHNSGWLALSAGLAGGADVILIPEIPYRLDSITNFLKGRQKIGKRFSIIAIAEGAMSIEEKRTLGNINDAGERKRYRKQLYEMHTNHYPLSAKLSEQIEVMTGIETRVTNLGHLQRGGTPTSGDRILATQFGVAAGECLLDGSFGVMVAQKKNKIRAVPLEKVVSKKKLVKSSSSLVIAARETGVCLGD